MDELLLHVLDIVQNSLSAGATLISVEIEERTEDDSLSIKVSDNGRGMDEETLRAVEDPFFTTKSGKKVGLGIPLLKQTVSLTGGSFRIESQPGKGTRVQATFPKSHIDLPPLGDLRGTALALIYASGKADIVFSYSKEGRTFSLDTREIREMLGEVPLSHPEVIRFLKKYIDDGIKGLEGKSGN
ncbi:MAG: ATP-binding protein [Caldiserica bacterium]|nr:ATP-binding protein [Caldisericota bacterium]MDH7562080.1 ATP-binding protein [Caldisericota bacterium]